MSEESPPPAESTAQPAYPASLVSSDLDGPSGNLGPESTEGYAESALGPEETPAEPAETQPEAATEDAPELPTYAHTLVAYALEEGLNGPDARREWLSENNTTWVLPQPPYGKLLAAASADTVVLAAGPVKRLLSN
jgi:hypothetical protein